MTTSTPETESVLASSPGLILKTARDELKLSIDHVAHELHLRSSVVKAMEDEDYDQFSSDVFLKGYFRSYCRLVSLHEERMVELLDTQLQCRKKAIETVALIEKKSDQAKTRKKVFIVLFVLIFLAGLGAYIFSLLNGSERIDDPDGMGSDSASLLSGVVVDEAKSGQALTGSALEHTTNETIQSETTKLANDSKVILRDANNTVLAEKEVVVQTTVQKLLQAKPVKSDRNGKVSLEQTSQAQQSSDREILIKSIQGDAADAMTANFTAVFSGDCWFKFTNGAGKTIFAALKQQGQQVKYSGPVPFTIVIGDATKANISLNGSVVDLKPHTAGNGRAKLTLSPSGA
jgi:cytoskeletal protein RodZ